MGQMCGGAGLLARPAELPRDESRRSYFDWVMAPLNSGGQLVPTW
jgi:hypothetical protein